MRKNTVMLIVVLLCLISPSKNFAQPVENNSLIQSCPGWVDVSLQWNKNVKEFCYQYGENCRAVSMMYEPPINEMYLEPLYGDYEDFVLLNPDYKNNLLKSNGSPVLQARKINCQSYVPSSEELAEKASNQRKKDECLAQNGFWDRKEGRGHMTGCTMPTKDAGKDCHGAPGECEGPCVNYKCYKWMSYRGCGIIDKDGKVKCVD